MNGLIFIHIFLLLYLLNPTEGSGKALHIPSGAHAVGYKSKYFLDGSRKESHSDRDDARRELVTDIWYPAMKGTKNKKQFPFLLWKRAFETGGVPNFISNYLMDFELSSQTSALISNVQTKWPIIVFSHGISAGMYEYQAFCEELASKGFVVIAVNHTYGNHMVQFPDGRIIRNKINWGDLPRPERVALRNKEQEIWVQDIGFIIQEIEKGQFKLNLDLNRLFIVGHSFGGSTAIQSLRKFQRVKAAVNLDGALAGVNPLKILEKPALMVMASGGHKGSSEEIKEMMKMSSQEHNFYILEGSIHDSFSDRGLVFSPSWLLTAIYWFQGARKNPVMILEETSKLIDNFLKEK